MGANTRDSVGSTPIQNNRKNTSLEQNVARPGMTLAPACRAPYEPSAGTYCVRGISEAFLIYTAAIDMIPASGPQT